MPSDPEILVDQAPVEMGAAPPRSALHGHFARGALESGAHILGSTSASVFAAGLVLPYIAAASGPRSMDGRELFAISAMAVVFSMLTGLGAVMLRGLAHCAPHKLAARVPGGDDR